MGSIVTRRESLVFRHDRPIQQQPALPSGIEHSVLDADSVEHFFRAEADAWRRRAYKRMLRRGSLGFLLHEGDQWASVGWVSTPGSSDPRHLSKRIVQPHYWTFFVHTAEEYRNRGLQKLGLWFRVSGARKHANDAECPVYTDVDPRNSFSRRAKVSFGFDECGIVETTSLRVPLLGPLNFGRWSTDTSHPAIDS